MIEIEGNKMEGYLWYSDQDTPVVYDGTKESFKFDDNDNPFVIEGQLYDTDKDISYSIKYVDGKYLVKKYAVKEIKLDSECKIADKYFQSHRMDGRVLHFMEIWRPAPDSLCEDIKVFQPADIIFVGFKKAEEKKL